MVYEDLESGTPGLVGLEANGGTAAQPSDDKGGGTKAAPASARSEEGEKANPKDIAALRSRIAELENSERYWAEKAKSAAPAPEPKKDDQPDELEALLASAGVDDDTAAGLLDDIGEKGVAALEKRGVVTKAQLAKILGAVEKRMEAKAAALADTRVNGAKDQLSAEAKLLKDFPDLADDKSEFAIAVGREFAAMVADDPSLKNSYGALRAAARVVSQVKTDTAMSRTQRIAQQSPARGAKAASEFDDEGDIEITPEARQLIAMGSRYGVTEESFKAHARRSR